MEHDPHNLVHVPKMQAGDVLFFAGELRRLLALASSKFSRSACADFAITHGVRSNAASPHTPTPQPPPGPPPARVHRLSTLWFWLGGLTSF